MRTGWKAALLLCLLTMPAWGQFQLTVGRGSTPWTEIADSSSLVEVTPDSIWIWPVVPGENLAANALKRGGNIYASGIRQVEVAPASFTDQRSILATRAVEAMVDDDPATAFDPDAAGVEREVEVYLDLGGTYQISRVRLFPRLDEQHRGRFPQTFELGLGERFQAARLVTLYEKLASFDLFDQRFSQLIRFAVTRPNMKGIVDWPGIQQVTGTRLARFLRYQPLSRLPWEIAELEVYAEGSVPAGLFVSIPLLARSGNPVWGQVRHEGKKPLDELPVVVQTRTGPDEAPVHYFIQTGERIRQVNRAVWENIEGIPGAAEKGPVRPNPEWSTWETVDNGIIRSPSPNRFLQFRVKLLEAGAELERLVFDYSSPPMAGQVQAEIDPAEVVPGAETAFVLTLQTRQREEISQTGYRFIEVNTPARVLGVDSVKVDDEPVVHTVRMAADGFTVNLWQRVMRDGSFVQLFFRGQLFVDGTRFRVRLLDRRSLPGEARQDTVYQFAREGDVEPLSVGGTLSVRLAPGERPLMADVERERPVFTPNGDGVNDLFQLSYSLLKLTRPAPVFFEVFDLTGQPVRQVYGGMNVSGRFVRLWDGRDDRGMLVEPGLYFYRVQVEADAGTVTRQGAVAVAY